MATPLGIFMFSTSGNWRGSERDGEREASEKKVKVLVRKIFRCTGSVLVKLERVPMLEFLLCGARLMSRLPSDRKLRFEEK